MKLTRSLAVLMMILVLALVAGTARGDMMKGSVIVEAFWAEMDKSDFASSTIFTPFSPAEDTIYLAGGTDDLLVLDFVYADADELNITKGKAWTFTIAGEGGWTTSTFVNLDTAGSNGFLNFMLTGMFTPDPGGSLGGFDPTPAEMRISLNQSGSRVSWGGSMDMVPEPMSMSILALGGLTALRRRRK